MEMIRQMGFVNYFLIVSDYVDYAKRSGIPVGPGVAVQRAAWFPTACISRTSIR